MIIKSVEKGRHFIAVFGLETQGVDVSLLLNNINELSRETSVTIQLFDSSLIATWEHLFFSALNALRAFSYDKNISNNLSVECLLYASGQRQISVAVKNFGVKPDTRSIGVILIGNARDLLSEVHKKVLLITKGLENETVLSINNKEKFDKIRSFFQITETELNTICDSDEWSSCVDALTRYCIEKSSLLILQK
jgi:tRNA threonylcarbamoyladenosine modification (KEOPS) complex Cgi121 subunit